MTHSGSATDAPSKNTQRRRIRSFVKRNGRLTRHQSEAIQQLWPHYGIDLSENKLDLQQLFPNSGPVTLEIGFGNGHSLAEMATKMPERNFIGIEVHEPGVGQLLHLIATNGLQNVRIFQADAIEVLLQQIPTDSLDRVQLFFPDPWHKKRHHKRRIVNDAFLELIADRLTPGGIFHMATDWEPYAKVAMEILSRNDLFANTVAPPQSQNGFAPRPLWRPLTKFEQRGERLGHGVWDLIFQTRA
ncbi:MAG: tRNA (guanosine(46)-N7)-methyltransferase TrmB [Thiotrichales bacterium]